MRRTRKIYRRPPRSRATKTKIGASCRAHHERVRMALALLDRVEHGEVEIREVATPAPAPVFSSTPLTFGAPASEAGSK
jgi:hypothetical protein